MYLKYNECDLFYILVYIASIQWTWFQGIVLCVMFVRYLLDCRRITVFLAVIVLPKLVCMEVCFVVSYIRKVHIILKVCIIDTSFVWWYSIDNIFFSSGWCLAYAAFLWFFYFGCQKYFLLMPVANFVFNLLLAKHYFTSIAILFELWIILFTMKVSQSKIQCRYLQNVIYFTD